MPTPGSKSSELKATATAGGLGVLPILLELLQGGDAVSERMMLMLIAAITLIAATFNISRGLAKKEKRNGSGASPTGAGSSEFKVTATLGGLGVLPVFLDMLKGGEAGMLTENIQLALLAAVSIIASSFVLSRGLAKEEIREPTPPPSTAG